MEVSARPSTHPEINNSTGLLPSTWHTPFLTQGRKKTEARLTSSQKIGVNKVIRCRQPQMTGRMETSSPAGLTAIVAIP